MVEAMDLVALLSGLGFGLSLIVAIGAQNAFVLRQGLRGERVGTVVAICAVSDAVLIALGVAGAGALVQGVPELADGARIGGAAFLLGYAALAARRAWRPGVLEAGAARGGSVLVTALALTWLNPHVYLDTVVLLGSVAATTATRAGGSDWAPAPARCSGSRASATAPGCCAGRSPARAPGARSTAPSRWSWARSASRS